MLGASMFDPLLVGGWEIISSTCMSERAIAMAIRPIQVWPFPSLLDHLTTSRFSHSGRLPYSAAGPVASGGCVEYGGRSPTQVGPSLPQGLRRAAA